MSACPKCSGKMEAGFIVDFTYGAVLPSSWLEGEPEKSWMGGVKVKTKRKLAITTDRCTRCGFLESYAKG